MATANDDRKTTGEPTEITSEEGKQRFGEYIARAGFGDERIVVTKHGKPVAAIIGMKDLAALEAVA